MSTYNVTNVRLIISQPRKHHLSEWTTSVPELLAFGEQVKAAAKACGEPDAPLSPSEHACKFCRAKAECPALQAEVGAALDLTFSDAEFDDLDAIPVPTDPVTLSAKMRMIPLIESWCKAVRIEVERQLLAGRPVEGYKLVKGRLGNRKWSNPAEVEALFKGMKLKLTDMYELSLISPTLAEKRTQPWRDETGAEQPPIIGPRQWKKVAEHITRVEGGLTVAPASDKRPAVTVATTTDTDFTNLDEAQDLL